MRPTPAIPVSALFVVVLWAVVLFVVAPAAYAEEAPPPAKKAKRAANDSAGREQAARRKAARERAAGEIGRALLSPNEQVRRTAVNRLLKRIEVGGDLGAFLDAMSRATQAWADRHERLMEVWLHEAIYGNAAERERAVRLLTALGERAIRRLALELRHARTHGGMQLDEGKPEPQAEEAARDELAAGTPRVYELADLVAHGMNPVQLRGLLQKAADAVEVKQFKTLFVVTAMDEGHQHLSLHLRALRARRGAATKPDVKPDVVKDDAPRQAAGGDLSAEERVKRDMAKVRVETARKAERGAGRSAPGLAAGKDDAPAVAPPQSLAEEAPAPRAPTAGAKGKAAVGSWHIEPTLFHLPRSTLNAIVATWGLSKSNRVLPKALLAETRTVVRTEDFARAADWLRALRRIPDARTGLPLRGATRVTAGGRTSLFAGKQIHYSKSVRRTKGGAWTIVTGTIPHGIGLDIALQADATTLRVDLVATRMEVGLPIPVGRVQPSEKAAPVELERPEWSTTRMRQSFDLPLHGGAALVSLKGLGSAPDDHLVLAVTLRKPAPKK